MDVRQFRAVPDNVRRCREQRGTVGRFSPPTAAFPRCTILKDGGLLLFLRNAVELSGRMFFPDSCTAAFPSCTILKDGGVLHYEGAVVSKCKYGGLQHGRDPPPVVQF